MAKPRLVQCLCGPARHAIIALGYDPGDTVGDGKGGSVVVTHENAGLVVASIVDELIAKRHINGWCGLCGSKRAAWLFEDRELSTYGSLQEARPALERAEAENLATAARLKNSRN